MIESIENSHVKCYLNWSGQYTPSTESFVEISGVFASKLGFEHEEKVIVKKSTERILPATRVNLEPLTESDWQMCYPNAEHIESTLNQKIRIIWDGLIFPIWVSGSNVCLFVRATHVLPDAPFVMLQEMTEVTVANSSELKSSPVKQLKPKSGDGKSGGIFSGLTKWFKPESSSHNSPVDDGSTPQTVAMSCITFNTKYRSLRVIPNTVSHSNDLWNTVFINTQYTDGNSNEPRIAKLTFLLSPIQKQTRSKTITDKKSPKSLEDEEILLNTFVTVYGTSSCPDDSVMMSGTLQRQLGLNVTSRVVLTSITPCATLSPEKISVLSRIKLTPLSVDHHSEERLYELIPEYLNQSGPIVCSKGTLIKLENSEYMMVCAAKPYVVLSDEVTEITLDRVMVERINTSWGSTVPLKKLADHTFNGSDAKLAMGGFEEVFDDISCIISSYLDTEYLSKQLNAKTTYFGSLLIHGPKGSGKSFLINHILQKYSREPHFSYVKVIDCKSLRGKRVDALEKYFSRELAEGVYRQPSIIVLEDLDRIVGSPSKPEEEAGVESLHNFRVAQLLLSLLRIINKSCIGTKIVLMATCQSEDSLHDSLTISKGTYFFNHIIEIKSPNDAERSQMIEAIIKNRPGILNEDCIQSLDLKEISRRTDGFLAADFVCLLDRVTHASSLKSSSGKICLSNESFLHVLDDFVPSSLRGVGLKVASAKKLSDVGGLADVKKVLMETLLWPLKYPTLFSKCPLRPQSCILLYGPSGTGKTLLAEAIAREAGINFITIEGPEILSKYIGASEQAVRDLFRRAEAAKPCILFFDEFDSIAPKRGHDSTGVTDRVVNQLLTQMDGVEGFERGLFILAATSRPDLIDPALLRPGRFDKCIRIGMPDANDRKEIFQKLSQNLCLSDDVDVDQISQLTEGYTGADIQAILYSSQLAAFNESLEKKSEKDSGDSIKCDDLSEDILDFHFLRSLGQDSKLSSKEDAPPEVRQAVSVMRNRLKDTRLEVMSNDGVDQSASREPIKTIIHMKHILDVLKTTKPSVVDPEKSNFR